MGKKDEPIYRPYPQPPPPAIFIVLRGSSPTRVPQQMSAWPSRADAVQAAGPNDTIVDYRYVQAYKLVLTPE